MPCSLKSALATMLATLFWMRRLDAATMPTSNRTGSVAAAAPDPSVVDDTPARLKRSGLVSMRLDQTPSCTTTVPLSTSAFIVPCSAEIGVDDRAEPFGIANRHALAGRREAQVAEREAVEADAAAEGDVAAAQTPGHLVDADAARVERHPAVDRLERVRQREMPEPAVVERGAAGKDRLGERAGQLRLEVGGAAAAQIAEEPLQDAEVRVARRLHVDRLVLQAQPAVELQLRALAGEPEPADLEDVLIERQLDRAVVAHAIVEELEVELLDARVDDELIHVGQLADDAHRAADDRGREGREARLEEAHVGIERRLAEPHRQLGVHLGA